jgi:hypothetical protein
LSLAWPAKFIAYAKQGILFCPRVDWDGETEFSFRARGNGITFTFSEKEWTALQKLFRRALQMPEVRLAWDALTLEYGEL